MKFRTLGGTVGLAQCSTVLNSKVKSGIASLIRSGILDASAFNSNSILSAVASIDQINALPGPAANGVREAFRNGTRWAFISLIPWTGLACFMVIFLSKIEDTDKQPAVANQNSSSDLEMRQRRDGNEADVNERPIRIGNTTVTHPGPKPKMKRSVVAYLVRRANWNANMKKYEKAMETQAQSRPENT